MAVMYRICAWCKTPLDPPTVEVADDDPMAGQTTHGVCEPCAKSKLTVKDHRKLADKAEEMLHKCYMSR